MHFKLSTRLFQFFLQVLHFIIEIVEAVDLQVITDATAVGCDGLVVGDAVEVEELLQKIDGKMLTFLTVNV